MLYGILGKNIKKSIGWRVTLIFTSYLVIIILFHILTFYLYFRQDISSQNADLLFLQNKSIESLSRKFLQVTILSNSTWDNSLNIYNLNLNIERDIKQINDCTEIMLKGGELYFDGNYQSFPPLDEKYHMEIINIRLLLNAFMFVKDIILKSSRIEERENKLVLLTSIIGQFTGKNQSILRNIKKEVTFNRMLFTAVMIITLVIILIVFLLFRQYVVGNIINPLKIFSERFVNLSEGNIGTEIEYIRKDEFGQLYKSLNIFIRILKGITSHLHNILTEADDGHRGVSKDGIKPYDMDDIFIRLNRAMKVKSNNSDREPIIAISDKNNQHFFPAYKIIYFSSSLKNTIIHTSERDISLNVTFKNIEERLPDTTFIRIHKQYIININYITRLSHIKSGHYKVLLDDDDDTELPVGRYYIASLKEKIQK